jgi:predicted transcriptional regulator
LRINLKRNKVKGITEAELRVMQILWDNIGATVADIVQVLPDPPLAYTTVQTMLRVLEQKGHVEHHQEGRAFYYRAITSREDATDNAVGNVLRHFFGGRPGALALRLLEVEHLDDNELERLERLTGQRGKTQ